MSSAVLNAVRTSYDPRYPIGKFESPLTITLQDRMEAVGTLADFPELLRNAVDGLDRRQLGTPYREGGWTLRQVVHHVADSHMNCLTRVKLGLTEDWPTIKTYDEGAWAKLHDGECAPVEWSLEMVESLHARWVMMLQGLNAAQWQRGFVHPESGRMTVEAATVQYAWHSKHHLAHICDYRVARGW